MGDYESLCFDQDSSQSCCRDPVDSNEADVNGITSLYDLDTAMTVRAPSHNLRDKIGQIVDGFQISEQHVDHTHDSTQMGNYIVMNNLRYDFDTQDDFGDIELMQNRNPDVNRQDSESECEYKADQSSAPNKDPDEDSSGSTTPNLPTFTMTFGRRQSDSDSSEDSGYESPIHSNSCKKKRKRSNVTRLWEFLADVLGNPRYCPLFLEWIDKSQGIFRFKQSKKVAQLWGEAKKKKKMMPYEHLSRALRHYYKRDILYRIPDRRLVYQFGPNAEGWRMRAKLV